jgi:hypothetical protein
MFNIYQSKGAVYMRKPEMKNRAISFVPVKVYGDAIDKSTRSFSDCGAADDVGESGGIELIITSAEERRS